MSTIIGNIQLRDYSATQRAGFTGILIGFILCGVGCFVPDWKTGSFTLFGAGDELKIREGIWTFCYTVIGMEEKCAATTDIVDDMSDIHKKLHIKDNSHVWLGLIYLGSFVCLVLSIACGLAACCRFCCCTGGRTLCHGIMTFLAGTSGMVAVITFAVKSDTIYGFEIIEVNYAWAFFIFATGSGILLVSSFLLCFANPPPNVYHHMMAPPPSGPSVIVQTSNSSQMNMSSGNQLI